MTLGAAGIHGKETALGVALGVVVAVANLWVLALVVRAFLIGTGPRLPWVIISLLKFGVLFGVVYGLVVSEIASYLALVVGWCALPIGIVVGQLTTPLSTSGD